jgi:3-oxoacyl-[acyl-carrier-protein] synthase I
MPRAANLVNQDRPVQALSLRSFTMTSAVGSGLASTLAALRDKRSGITRTPWETVDLDTCIGELGGLDAVVIRPHLKAFDCRNNRLAQVGLEQDGFAESVRESAAKWGPGRVGVFLGTSTSGILSSELAYRQRDAQTGALPASLDYRHTHNSFSVAEFVRQYFGLAGPAFAVSTACSSSGKVFGSAQRMIELGLIDAAVVGGVDSLCLTTLYGFNSLQLLSPKPCTPYDRNRDGITIGEAAAFALLERSTAPVPGDIVLSGIGESSDAHHMSAPHPQGLGATLAMQSALQMAGVDPQAVDYVALHGTSTPSNDVAEAKAVSGLFGTDTPCSSLKGHFGHTLGAAGAANAVVCALALRHELVPAGAGTRELDPALNVNYVLENVHKPMRHAVSNSFGFGGSNCSLVLSKVAA